jgi:hypothetical protein
VAVEDSRQYFEARAAQCRRLAQGVGDARTIQQLTEMALEFDAKARKAGEPEGRQRPTSRESPEAET